MTKYITDDIEIYSKDSDKEGSDEKDFEENFNEQSNFDTVFCDSN